MTFLSRLTIPTAGIFTDFYPQPISRSGVFQAGVFAADVFRVAAYSEESPLIEGAETKLITPLVFEESLPDDFDGTPGVLRSSAELSNINLDKIPSPRQLLGLTAISEQWEVETETLVKKQSGMITEISAAPERLSLTIEQNAAAPLQVMIPRRLVKDIFPSADFTGVNSSGDPCVIIPWGTMYKVPLPLVQRPYLHCEFQMQASTDSAYYVSLSTVPTYTVQTGDVLQYDVQHLLSGSQIGIDVATAGGTTLRATATVDTNGFEAHPNANLDSVAVGKWYRREIPLTAMVGLTLFYYTVGCEANTTRSCLGYIANAQIVSAQGDVRLVIFNELTDPAPATLFNVPLTNVGVVQKMNLWDYGPIRSSSLIVHSVYNGTRAVNPADYTVAEPFPDLLTIRFTAAPRDVNGAPAVISSTFSTPGFGQNPATIKQFFFLDGADGVGVTVDLPSFGNAALALNAAGIFADGGLATQRQALDVIGDLCFHGEVIGMNDAGQYTDTCDTLSLHALNPLHVGVGDGEWENVSFAPASYRLLDQFKSLTLKAAQVQDFGGSSTFAVTSTRSHAGLGSVVTQEAPYLSPRSVDQEVDYRFKRNQAAALYRAQVTGQSLELRTINVNDLVTVHCPNDPDMDGQSLVVSGRTLSPESITFTLRGHNANIYTYDAQPVQTTGIPPLVDYRFTIPGTPTNFTVINVATYDLTNGTTKTFVTLQADAPGFNVTDLKFRGLVPGSELFAEVPVAVTLGQTNVRADLALEPSLTYNFEVYAYNGSNDPAFRFSEAAQILNYTVAGDTLAPAAPTALSVRQSGAKVNEISISANVPADWGTTYLYRSTVDSTGTSSLIDSGKKLSFHDQSIAYGTTYFYWARIVDTSGNISGFSPSGSHAVVVGRLVTDDYNADSITFAKIAANQIGSVHLQADSVGLVNMKVNSIGTAQILADSIANVNMKADSIGTLNVQALSIGTIKIQGDAVTSSKRQLINTLTASYSIPMGSAQTINFTHVTGRIPLVSWDTNNSNIVASPYNVNTTQIWLVLHNMSSTPGLISGTIEAFFW